MLPPILNLAAVNYTMGPPEIRYTPSETCIAISQSKLCCLARITCIPVDIHMGYRAYVSIALIRQVKMF